MPEERMPFVAIIGGFYAMDAALIDEAKSVARNLGAALADAGFGLVVYFSDDDSLEPHVVSGYVTEGAENLPAGAIRVRYAESQRGEVEFAEEATNKDLFHHRIFPRADWEAPFYRSLVEAEGVDAVLMMAGGRSTLIAGQVAVARQLPILAIDHFEGSAREIWKELAAASQDYPSWNTHDPEALANWLKEACAAEARQREQAALRESMFERWASQRAKGAWAAGAFVLLLVALFFGVARPPMPALYTFLMLAGLIASGATGALIKAVIWGPEQAHPGVSLLLGSVAGFVVGLAYLIPQWVGAPGVLEATSTDVEATDKIQFVSSVLVAISAGVGFDTVFSRLKKQAEEAPISPGA